MKKCGSIKDASVNWEISSVGILETKLCLCKLLKYILSYKINADFYTE